LWDAVGQAVGYLPVQLSTTSGQQNLGLSNSTQIRRDEDAAPTCSSQQEKDPKEHHQQATGRRKPEAEATMRASRKSFDNLKTALTCFAWDHYINIPQPSGMILLVTQKSFSR
jgi:hypothetical protein